MKIATKEMLRRPGRFITAAILLGLVGLLVMFLGGLLDGLIRASTAAITAQQGEVIVFSTDAESSFIRSRVPPTVRGQVEAAPGVTEVGGIGVAQLGARVASRGPRDLIDVAVFGYQTPPRGIPTAPPAGKAWADESLRARGVAEGSRIEVGPARTPVEVAGFVNDIPYSGASSLWASPETWRGVLDANRPGARVGEDVFQALVVSGTGEPASLAAAIDLATGGTTRTLTIAQAANAVPGIEQQRSVFNQIIGVTIMIAIVVIALFFALLTVERQALYGVLKALGGSTRSLFGGLVTQAVLVALVATAVSGAIALGIAAAIPPGSIPLALTPGRVAASGALLLIAAVLGCAFSLRRVLRVDPATAIGSSS